ncbi:MAG TPA: alpha/beta fold hydrolase [Stellaceae bacterium]|nr:alpha/beta fold hydrolase [Stellaceae bacterium]
MAISSKPEDERTVLAFPTAPRPAMPPPAPSVARGETDADAARAEIIDRLLHAWQGRLTSFLAPAALLLPFTDWAVHLANAPGKQAALIEKALRKWARFGLYLARSATDKDTPPCIEPLPQDHRFTGDAWREPPFRQIYQAFLLQQQWWHNATTDIRGVAAGDERVVAFAARQILDVFSPSNFVLTNPEVLRQTLAEGGQNFVRGALHFIEDWERAVAGRKPVGAEAFQPGREVAVTPGKVVYRNDLIELIQYMPTAQAVHPEPVLIVPAWIMKYYILDLSPENSLARYLVENGFTVFMISWRNPTSEQRDLDMDDYRRLGILAALDVIGAICGEAPVHACGYCLGGTLLAITAAAMARDDDNRLKTLTLFAAQTDFSEAGELTLFTNESQIAYLEDTMWEQGYLDARQMAGAFQLLRSNDLIWSQVVRQYLKGERVPMTDLMAWNADATRLPYRMHAEYLRRLFLGNDLAEGRYIVDNRPVALSDIRIPAFVVATLWDHVAPWRSVHKMHLLCDTDITFVLTSGGHNVGIVNPPPAAGRSYQRGRRPADGHYVDPESWIAASPVQEGSWWLAWSGWLAEQSSPLAVPPPLGAAGKGYPPLADAPGRYVLDE